MKTTIENVKKALREHINELNSSYNDHYRAEYEDVYNKDQTTADLISYLDIDSTEFNAGFEQGYMKALEEIIRMEK